MRKKHNLTNPLHTKYHVIVLPDKKEAFMKKILLAVTILLVLSLVGGCSKSQGEAPSLPESSAASTESVETPSVETPTVETDSTETTTPPLTEAESDTSSDSSESVYAQQVERYYEALSNQWDEGTCFEREISPMVSYYYEGNALDNVGYALMDLNADDTQELIIGAIKNAEHDPLVFEIWTLKNGEPVMLAQSGSRNRYYMQYAKDDGLWSVAYEAENGAANHAVYYVQLVEGEFEVMQGIIFDAVANENNPLFMTYDLDWDTSNDTPIDEETAKAVMDAERNNYTALEYHPYS